MILYEYPCNERIRTFLRVEALFNRLAFATAASEPVLHHVAVNTLFDLLDMIERTDLRSMVLQDLERQRAELANLREHPQVATEMLDSVLDEIKQITLELAEQERLAQSVRENEWLISLRGRMAIPGGSSQVDVPSFHGWQHQPVAQRQRDIQRWSTGFLPLKQAIDLTLRILRGAGDAVDRCAEQGAFQEMSAGRDFQLLRLWVDSQYGVYPEMSANKYVVLVRFAKLDKQQKAEMVKARIPFQLARCYIG